MCVGCILALACTLTYRDRKDHFSNDVVDGASVPKPEIVACDIVEPEVVTLPKIATDGDEGAMDILEKELDKLDEVLDDGLDAVIKIIEDM